MAIEFDRPSKTAPKLNLQIIIGILLVQSLHPINKLNNISLTTLPISEEVTRVD